VFVSDCYGCLFFYSASGASTVAYWLANFLFDCSLLFSYVIIFAIVLAIFCPDSYTGDGFGYVVAAGCLCTIAAVFRFYSFSYFIADVRLAQSIYFYGSIGAMYVLVDMWFIVLFTAAGGNINESAVQVVSMIFACIDPFFGWFLIIVYQNNFVGILTQNQGEDFLSYKIGGAIFYMLILSAFIYGFLFIFFAENALGGITNLCSLNNTVSAQTVNPMQIEGASSRVNQIHHPDANKGMNKEVTERSSAVEDPDVIEERKKVHAIADRGVLNVKKNAILICNLRKIYYARGSVPSKVAIQNINLSIPQGEIFGLLGANGAGKVVIHLCTVSLLALTLFFLSLDHVVEDRLWLGKNSLPSRNACYV
jgi:ABC-type multidrug transport system fused ATPase/permease subunit